ncbi:hypothetical protein AGMMS50276_00560 [Synergistales bacterium]|nr:hypothetical protein AGMMS50276_00560 [Synergistales bacterium]
MADSAAVKKKGFKFPHAVSFLTIMVIIVIGLTWIVPAGEYNRESVTLASGAKQTRVVSGTYHEVAQTPQAIWKLVPDLVKGFTQSADMVFMVLFCGGAIYVLEKTGTVRVFFQRLVKRVVGKEHWAIFIVMLLMSLGGATGAFANNILALLPLGMILARGMGFDNAVGFGMIYLGAYAGFNVGWANLFTIGIAQNIAELEVLSGFYVRVLFHVVNFFISYLFVARYAKRVKGDYTISLNYEDGMSGSDVLGTEEDAAAENEPIAIRHTICAIITFLGFFGIVWGSIQWSWGVPDYSAVFVAIGILCGLCGGLGIDGTGRNFVAGCGTIVTGAFVIGVARAISIVMNDGKIIDTIVYYLSLPISHYGPVMGANLMFYANAAINFFIPSGSGQAVAVMPLMVPLADLSGITRQVAVQAFQFGDGFSNCIIPTAGTLMSSIAMAKMSYGKYVKWFAPFIILQTVLASIALTVLQIYGWN